ncbi:hypothetical protein TKK_0016226 [Trichogramma kaykai]|uniref:Cytochrome P450 n=1 Tax=Trichogramma kaykai TaxID=54128 RepID=A0ABD2W7D1_9HYME
MWFYVVLALVEAALMIMFAHFYLHMSKTGRAIDALPGPRAIPVLGNLLQLHVTLVELFGLLREWGAKYYPVYRLWFSIKPVVFIQHPDDIEILLMSSKHINKEMAYEHLYSWLQTGLLTSGDKKWHQRRKLLTPAFHFNVLKKYMEITFEQSNKAVTDLESLGKETNVNLLPYCSKYTLNIICESSMGVSLTSEQDNNEAKKYKDAVYKIGNIIVYRLLRPYILDWMLHFMPQLNKETKNTLGYLHRFTSKIVNERREYHISTGYQQLNDLNHEADDDTAVYGKKRRLAMLDLLITDEKNGLIDDAGINEEVSTFIFEGHDTTALAMCYAILLLAENKEAQKKAREEVEELLKPKNGAMDTSDLLKMNYLERCIKETIRLYPSVPMIARRIDEDLQLKHCLVPQGSNVFVHLFNCHRDPHFWSEPDKFDPDRFLPDEIKKRHPFCYVPFSAGYRNCIGQKFAMMELKSLIARILYDFYLEPIDHLSDIKIQSDIVLRPATPVQTKFIKIDRS